MHLSEAISIEDKEQRDRSLRRSFASLEPWLEAEGVERITLIILLNLTRKRAEVGDLCDVELAKTALANPEHLSRCVRTIRWLHTHNLKYPDTRVHGQRLLVPPPPIIGGVVTSAGLPVHLGWANNSADVNCAKLFSGTFLYRGNVTNLAMLLCEEHPVWIAAFSELGIPLTTVHSLAKEVGNHLNESRVPSTVSPFSKQVRFPYRDSQGELQYLAVTPVISHSLMAAIQRSALAHKIRFSHVHHAHPASVGDLAAARGGRLAVLHYPPPVLNSRKPYFHISRQKRNINGLFDHAAICNTSTIRAMAVISGEKPGLTRQRRRRTRASALMVLRRQLANWLAPVIEWRDEVERIGESANSSMGLSLAERVVTIPLAQLPELATELAESVHVALQEHQKGRFYAYHPSLVVPLKSQLNWLLNRLAGEGPKEHSTHDGSFFLHLSGLRVYDALALSSPYVCGLPSMTALGGLAHHYERRLQQQFGCQITVEGTAWFIRHFSLNSGNLLPEPDRPEKYREMSNVVRPGIIDSRTCDLVMDLVLGVRADSYEHVDDVAQFLAAFPSRFAGGSLLPPALFEQSTWCRLYQNSADLFRQLTRLPRNGCWVYPYESSFHTIDGLLEAMSSRPNLRPTTLGFVGLEPPLNREGGLEQLHCYGEPAVGLVLCLNPIAVRLNGHQKFFDNAFWRMNNKFGTMLMEKSSMSSETEPWKSATI